MNELQEITDYIHSMKIKKTIFGGYEREDVLVKMGELTSMFQRYIDELRKEEQEKQKQYQIQLGAYEEKYSGLLAVTEQFSQIRETLHDLEKNLTDAEALIKNETDKSE